MSREFFFFLSFSRFYAVAVDIFSLGGGMEDILSHIFGGFGGGMFGKWIF